MIGIGHRKKKLAHVFDIVTFVFLMVWLIGCNKANQLRGQEDTLARIERTGQIDACTVVEPPFVIKDAKTGELSGVYVDALNIIAQKMNATVNWHETTWGNVTSDLAAKRCDVVATAIFALIPRALAVSFVSPPVAYQGLCAIVRGKDAQSVKAQNIFAFDKPGIVVSVPTGTASDAFVTEHFKKATIRRIDGQPSDPARNLTEVSANRADMAVYTTDGCKLFAQQHPEVVILFQNPPISLFPIAWATRQDDVKWLHFLETALQFLDTQGTMAQLEKKYNAHLIHLVKQYKVQ